MMCDLSFFLPLTFSISLLLSTSLLVNSLDVVEHLSLFHRASSPPRFFVGKPSLHDYTGVASCVKRSVMYCNARVTQALNSEYPVVCKSDFVARSPTSST